LSTYRNWNYANHFICTEEQKTKIRTKISSGEWFGAIVLRNQVQDQMQIQEKKKAVLSEDGKSYSITGQKMWIRMQVSVAYSSFLLVLDDKNITGFIVENERQ
jgi:alkylation response protein AidB-like acyl-CoA dehydrogenase